MEGRAMDVLKAQIDRISKLLAGLSASQKMLTASLVAIMVMTLLYWARYAGAPEMVEVTDAPLSAEQLPQVQARLRAEGIEFTVVGDKLLVPADRHLQAVAALAQDQMLPRDSAGGFDDVLSKLSPFAS